MRTATATALIISIFLTSSVITGIIDRPSNATLSESDIPVIIALPARKVMTGSQSTTTRPTTSEPTAPPPMDPELETISKGCITISDYKLLTNNDVTWFIASMIGRALVEESVSTIGLMELRGALHFSPMAPWTKTNYTEPSEQELASATLEQYYDLKEPKSMMRSLDSLMIMEKDIPRGVAFMDGRFPGIRMIFAQKFQKMMRKGGKMVMDRKMVDRMIEEYSAMNKKIRDAIEKTSYNNYCWDRSSLF
ncbi:hypothetical protein GCK72_007839 [Caenorhabditis remanei]|uniref:Uncharacterized protein n=1 Tax=Caenorhabditis remanei TaxID=31234 RepID=A0A6A5HI99_CAERE|nr:hypothetical protein GCK72_007839 [Caenorhabditis remanei]KAF1767880.1 hypothetical protein GCK72_007839 [Caenorhabditis remanei]